MTPGMLIVLALVAAAVILFATEKLRVDLVALIILAALLASRLITPEEALSGFSNTATLTVGAMFVLSAGLYQTGAVNFIGDFMARLTKRNFWLALIGLMITAGLISAFINNTPVVAIFIPILLGAAREAKLSASRLLMPLSFASMFGGVCTLIGTSTNILVSAIAEAHGQPPFRMFEFAPLGLIFFAAGLLYMTLVGVRLIPERRAAGELTETFGMGEYLTEIVLLPEGPSVGKRLTQAPLVKDLDIEVLEVIRREKRLRLPSYQIVLEPDDILRVRCDVEKIKKLQEREGIALKPDLKWHDQDLESEETVLVEAAIAPNSRLVGKTLKGMRFRDRFGATALAIRQRNQLMHEQLETTRLRPGDALLLEVKREHLEALKELGAFVLISEVGLPSFRKRKVLPALAIVLGVVATATLGVFPIVVSAIIGGVLMVLVGCITLEEAYQAVEWQVIFLLAGVLSLGVALEKTGAAAYLSDVLLSTIGGWGPVAVVAALYLLTSLLTNAMSNNATAALLAPIAISAAATMDVDARPFLMAVTFAASSSFMTPVGYQTNTLIYGAGHYQFTDFLRVGTPLNVIFWLLGSFLIPQFWPF